MFIQTSAWRIGEWFNSTLKDSNGLEPEKVHWKESEKSDWCHKGDSDEKKIEVKSTLQ